MISSTRMTRAIMTRGHRIVIPSSLAAKVSAADGEVYPSEAIGSFVNEAAADELNSRMQLQKFSTTLEERNADIWKNSKPHLRKQQKLIDEFGVDGAVRESLQPSTVSFTKELSQRPLDKSILEEIYRGLHGRRVERKLKRGVTWEHWIAKGDGTAPVFNTSQKTQQTFGFGEKLQRIASARHEQQFPRDDAHRKNKRRGGVAPLPVQQHTTSSSSAVVSHVPEVAFIGRTNVGKSSLINSVVNALCCPYGQLQGTTTTAGFYSVARKVVLVDLPGYGYYNPLQTPQIDAENAVRVMKAYLDRCDPSHSEARPIKRVFLCSSSRGLQTLDLHYLDLLESKKIPFGVILTKTDVCPIRYLARVTDHVRSQLVRYKYCQEMFLSSALRLSGIDKIQELIGSVALAKPHSDAMADMDFSRIV